MQTVCSPFKKKSPDECKNSVPLFITIQVISSTQIAAVLINEIRKIQTQVKDPLHTDGRNV